MNYVSTRGTAPVLGFEEAMLAGLALDGGLYVPETWPQFSHDEIAALAGLSYEETAYRVMAPFVGDAFPEGEFRAIITRAYACFDHVACFQENVGGIAGRHGHPVILVGRDRGGQSAIEDA